MLKLIEAEKALNLKFPKYLFDFISKLKNEEFLFGDETWLFWSVTETLNSSKENFIIDVSKSLSEEWKFQCLVFATNGIGDYIFLKDSESKGQFDDEIYFLMHETAEIRLFADNWNSLLKYGTLDYYNWDNNFIFKLDDFNNVIRPDELSETQIEKFYTEEELENLQYFKDQDFKSKIDDLIDEAKEENLKEILDGLFTISSFKDDSLKSWAFNKLSDIYLKGYLSIRSNYELALSYNQKAIDLNSHKAFSNRAAAYFAGLGVEKSLTTALELATKANEISKNNSFVNDLTSENNEGLYEDFLKIIRTQLDKESE